MRNLLILFSIQQWAFKEVGRFIYTNEGPFEGQSMFEFQFQVIYKGSISWNPKVKFTEPPAGHCVVRYANHFIV